MNIRLMKDVNMNLIIKLLNIIFQRKIFLEDTTLIIIVFVIKVVELNKYIEKKRKKRKKFEKEKLFLRKILIVQK